jgi:hypothetical protein
MSAERNNVEVRELRNLGGPSRSFRLNRKDRVPAAKWALKGKKRLIFTYLLLFLCIKWDGNEQNRVYYDPPDESNLYD